MLFKQGQIALDTNDMITYETGIPGMPYIYQSHCGKHVLLAIYDVTAGIQLHYATPSEITFYAHKFALPNLLRASEPDPPN